MKELIEAWRKKAVWENQKAKEYYDVWSQGHGSAAMIYQHCANELERHLSNQSSGQKITGECLLAGCADAYCTLNNKCQYRYCR